MLPRGSVTKDVKLTPYRNLAPRNSRAKKPSRIIKQKIQYVSEEDESDVSPAEEQHQEQPQEQPQDPSKDQPQDPSQDQSQEQPQQESQEDSDEQTEDQLPDGSWLPRLPGKEPTHKLPEEMLRNMYKTPGILMIAGLVSWDLVARRENNPTKRTHPNLYTFHKFTDRKYRFIASSCSSGHSVLIDEHGQVYTFGRNTFGQLGLGDTVTRNVPEPVPKLRGKNIIQAAVGRNHTLFITDAGVVYAAGDNKCGQCGIGFTSPSVPVPTRIRYKGAPIIKVGCGAEFSMILDCVGGLHSFGLPEYGQLGHNTDGKYFVTSTKLSFHYETAPKHIAYFFEKNKDGHVNVVEDVVICDFSCGTNHTVAIDSKKRAYSWGFGGFGRLGHAEPKDEKVPRMIKYFESQSRGVRSVHCGGTYSLAVNEIGSLFMFGQTKRTGEANMYPKPVQDLSGWNIHSIGTSNSSIVIAADESLVAWGVSPTYGELGTGDINKSSARPKEVSRMEGLKITQVTMGYSHTLLLCDDQTEETKIKLASMPTFNP